MTCVQAIETSLTPNTEPTVEPVTWEDMEFHSRDLNPEERAYVEGLIKSARRHCEMFCRRRFINSTWNYYLSAFPSDWIALPYPPLVSVSSITYLDTAGVSQTLATSVYQVDAKREPGRVGLAYGQSWPGIRTTTFNPITIVYVAGYGAAATSVPDGIKHAIKLLAAHWYEHREPIITGTISADLALSVESLLWEYRLWEAA